jgi:hypothetical protein
LFGRCFADWTFVFWVSAYAALVAGQTQAPVAAESFWREALRMAKERFRATDKALARCWRTGLCRFAYPLVHRAFAIAEEWVDRKLTRLILNTLGVVPSGEREFALSEFEGGRIRYENR